MSKTKDEKRIVGGFFARFLIIGLILGTIAIVLETCIPVYANWGLDSRRVIFQSVVSIIATICTIYFSISMSIKDVTFNSKEEANNTIKPIKSLLILFALFFMCAGLLYCVQIEKSEIANFEHKIKYEDEYIQRSRNNLDYESLEKNKIHLVSNIMLATKEIMTVLAFAYGVVYTEKMILTNVEEKKLKKEDDE